MFRWSQLLAPSCDARDRSRLQQLIELAYSYQAESTLRPADFLEFIERQKVSDPTSSAVRVMTVHQAKGLEFDIVFLPELDSGRTLLGQAPWVVTSRDRLGGDIDCVCRYANEHVQKLLPPSYRRMFSAAAEAQIGEALCVMYVAMTRAIHALHLLIEPARENERGLPKTFAGLLRAALLDNPSTDVGLLYEHGQSNWYDIEKKRRRLTLDAPAAAIAATPAQIALAPPSRERRRGLERQSPSRLEGGASARLRQALELVDPNRNAAMLRGMVIHAWFEQVLWLDDGMPSDARLLETLATIRGTEALSEHTRRVWLKDFHAMLGHKDIAAALTKSAYCKSLPKGWSKRDVETEVRNEWPFAVIDGAQIFSGRMDRVVFHRIDGQTVAADVLDFKTDVLRNRPGDRLDDRVEHYRPQMEAYGKTLMHQTGLPGSQVSRALLFVDAGIVVRL
jgi:ATP-dependent helicase/nuclease subunit A